MAIYLAQQNERPRRDIEDDDNESKREKKSLTQRKVNRFVIIRRDVVFVGSIERRNKERPQKQEPKVYDNFGHRYMRTMV